MNMTVNFFENKLRYKLGQRLNQHNYYVAGIFIYIYIHYCTYRQF